MTCFQALKSQSKESGGCDKFAPLVSSLGPFSIPAWGTALLAVDRFFVSQQSGHYAFPDPGLFVTPATNKKKAKFIKTWLRIRTAWILCVVHEGSLSMSSQHWHDFLSTNFSSLLGTSDSKAMKHHHQLLETLTPRLLYDPGVKPRNTIGEPFF